MDMLLSICAFDVVVLLSFMVIIGKISRKYLPNWSIGYYPFQRNQNKRHRSTRSRKRIEDSYFLFFDRYGNEDDDSSSYGEESFVCKKDKINHVCEDTILLLSIQLQQYFAVENNKHKLLKMIRNNNDGFFRNVLHNDDFEFPVEDNHHVIEMFDVHQEYNKMMEQWGEAFFYFRSNINTIFIGEMDQKPMYTSLRQLHFYYWFFENVYDYAIVLYEQ